MALVNLIREAKKLIREAEWLLRACTEGWEAGRRVVEAGGTTEDAMFAGLEAGRHLRAERRRLERSAMRRKLEVVDNANAPIGREGADRFLSDLRAKEADARERQALRELEEATSALQRERQRSQYQGAALDRLAGIVDALNAAAENPSMTNEELGARVRSELANRDRRANAADGQQRQSSAGSGASSASAPAVKVVRRRKRQIL